MTKSSSLIAIVASCLSLSAIVAVQFKPFDEKSETAATKKIIEAKYVVLSDAIFNADYEKADTIIHESFTMLPALDDVIDDDATEDESDYLDAIETNNAILSVQKERSPEGTKVERKIVTFVSGRRLATAVYIETMKGDLIDTEGEFGEKGKKHTLETTARFHDQWYKGVSDDAEEPDWYLFDREATSIVFKMDGKPFTPKISDGVKLFK